MSELDDLQGSSVTLDALAEGGVKQPQTTPHSIRSKAAHAALIAGDAVENNFNLLQSDMSRGEFAYMEGLVRDERDNEEAYARQALYDIIGNPNISEEEKAASVQAFNEDTLDTREIVSTNSIAASSAGEDEEDAMTRLSHGSYVKRMAEANKEIQALINAEAIEFDPHAGKAFLDMVEFWFVPFVESNQAANIQEKFASGDITAGQAGWALMGASKKNVVDILNAATPEHKVELVRYLLQVINSESDVRVLDGVSFLPTDNQFASYTWLSSIVEDGYYSSTEELLDNVITVIDFLPLAGPAVRAIRAGVRGRRSASSPLETVGVDNPQQTRAMMEAIEQDTTGEASAALTGVSRDEAIVDQMLPEMLDEARPVRAKVANPGEVHTSFTRQDEAVYDRASNSGATHLTIAEKDAGTAHVINMLKETSDMTLQSNVSEIGHRVDGKVLINAIYGKKEGGWRTANDAVSTAMFNLRKLGVRENDLTVYKLSGDGYVPVTREELSDLMVSRQDGDFRVGLNFEYEINPFDVGELAQFDVKYNIFDRVLGTRLSSVRLQRNILDPISMFDPQFFKPATAAVTRAAGIESALIDIAVDFGEQFRKLDANSKELVTDYIHQANREGLAFDPVRLAGEGHNQQTLSAISKFRQYWDTQYVLENRDLAKTLKAQKYQVLEDSASGTRLFAKPVGNNYQRIPVYDPVQNTVRQLEPEEWAAAYEKGGFVARTKDVLPDGVEHIYVRNNKNSFLRELTDHDTVLHYRPGYYTVFYKSPVFIEKFIPGKTATGVQTLNTKAIATARNFKEAEEYLARAAAREGKTAEEYGRTRGAKEGLGRTSNEYWEQQLVQGRTAQMYRGKRLEEADAPTSMSINEQHILGPVDSMLRGARSVSERVSLRDWLTTSKERFVQQYGEVLPQVNGQATFPRSAEEITRGPGFAGDKLVADARTTYEYIQYMENGYVNSIDSAWKSMFRSMAQITGRSGLGKTQEAFDWAADMSPTGLLKGTAFRAYLSTNPARQILIQAHQAVQLAAIEPRYTAKTLFRDMPALGYILRKGDGVSDAEWGMLEKFSGRDRVWLTTMSEIVHESGILKAVDKSNLLQGEMKYLADSLQTSSNPLKRGAASVENTLRRWGFDLGEQYNLLSAFLVHYEII
jgi:hypothetical protein